METIFTTKALSGCGIYPVFVWFIMKHDLDTNFITNVNKEESSFFCGRVILKPAVKY